MPAKLFTPFNLGQLTLSNRIVIAPMCTYSASEGCANDWHVIHYGGLALSGAGLLTIEATAVAPEGRITYGDIGLWNDDCEAALGKVLASVRRWSDMPVAIQIAHAGRKASTDLPWNGGAQLPPGSEHGWQTVSSSAQPFEAGENAPVSLDRDGLKRIREAFAEAAKRAVRLGFDAIQVHSAHGYLLHQFLSPLANTRDDEYGGGLENRLRFPLEVFDAMREAVPDKIPLTARMSGTDWVDGGWDIDQTVAYAKALEARGCTAIHISSGGLSLLQKIPLGPNYQVPLARAVKQAVKIPVVTVGLITEAQQAEAIVGTGDADLVAVARAVLYDPRWPWHAAAALGARVKAAPQYLRSAPRSAPDLFKA
ncbi:NADH:flavin oxidoreductase/NADH oxidase [Rhizomicrobium electricum]|uniref:NADH:flavin oxidoreductase/NADH oxidase n=1 Tax=Rhizomicrobium electricum TaxID=480070 RepID=A0ABN1E9S1_9PROT|nr:NADH:flavin oxidoreductase/NADH oxidase [Rhizomicrobium electricum]NIJ48025.1 2,4-dienoyl-CoA reductase-like NADH-dependent reductase (Old Yellow Enzyme family) [Rhizomicrobium electricum]